MSMRPVLSACVQMPSLAVVDMAAQEFAILMLPAATATAAELVRGEIVDHQLG
jgi:hypothetical protein